MILDDHQNYYDLLELTPDASPQELRAAYLRAKTAYRKDSVALYTLISEEETEELIQRIEEAYHVLSDPERRKNYDRKHELLLLNETEAETKNRPSSVVSINRVPPMENIGSDADVLIAPKTDFEVSDMSTSNTTNIPITSIPISAVTPQAPLRHSSDPNNEQALTQEISQETEWRGPFLRRIRDARKVSLEELSEFTKISRTYITAIEEENYPKLPAAVYLRGFITQIARFLRLPHEKVASAYMARYLLTTQGKQ